MRHYLGQKVPVLVEGKRKKRWYGREPRGKLVFFEDERELRGELVEVRVTHTGAWSMSGTPAGTGGDLQEITASGHGKGQVIPLNVL